MAEARSWGLSQLIASLLGLTWDNIRARIVRKGVPEQAVGAVEKTVPVAQALAREGPAGAVDHMKNEVGDLKATILSKLTSYLIPTDAVAAATLPVQRLQHPPAASSPKFSSFKSRA